VHQPLHLFEDRSPLLRILLAGLQRVVRVDVGIAATPPETTDEAGRGAALPNAPLAPRSTPRVYFFAAYAAAKPARSIGWSLVRMPTSWKSFTRLKF
jgi:hypothetical protein